MKQTLHHRGPDSSDIFAENSIALSHCRLSIIDLSENAAQPMISADKRYVIVFNGEIYNFREIRKYLLENNPAFISENSFQSQSDTEAVLELFALIGTDCVKQLNGMFAFSIYDRKENKLFLFRDRIGIKPLFFTEQKGSFYFASELKALNTVLSEKKVNRKILPAYFQLGYFPEPHTIIEDVFKLPAGSYGIYDGKDFSTHTYWKACENFNAETFTDKKDVIENLKSFSEQAVKDCLISDVPVGVFLSGGIDSSLVASIASKVSSQPLHTFTVSVPDKMHDESIYASSIAKHLGTIHHELTMEESSMLSATNEVLLKMDEPFADSSIIPTFLVSQFTCQTVKVALSGDGGDELFMGYGAYRWAMRLQKYSNPFIQKFLYLLLKILPGERYQRVSQFFNKDFQKFSHGNIFSVEQNLFPSWETEKLLSEFYGDDFSIENLSRKLNPMEIQAFYDLTHYLKDDLLVKVDRASMMNSLEVRPPLLDHRLVSYAQNISSSLKFKEGEGKFILKELLETYLPRNLFDRPKKGFSIPLARWLRKELKYLIDEFLTKDSLRIYSIIEKKHIDHLLNDFLISKNNLPATRIWTIIVLSYFLETHKDIQI